METWGFLFSVMSSPIVYFLTILLAVCPNINPTILCAHVCDVTMRRAINNGNRIEMSPLQSVIISSV